MESTELEATGEVISSGMFAYTMKIVEYSFMLSILKITSFRGSWLFWLRLIEVKWVL